VRFDDMIEISRWLLVAGLLFLPGAWITFLAPVPLSFAARLGLGGALSPGVLAAEIYALGGAGVGFTTSTWVVALANLPAIALILRKLPAQRPSRTAFVAASIVFLFLAGITAVPYFVDDSVRLYHSHGWMHGAIVYEFFNGTLVPEEPELAGVRLAYPWLAHAGWAVLSALARVTPSAIYPLANLASLAWTLLLVFETSRRFGVRAFAGLTALVWLALGTNAAGYAVSLATGSLPGDIRYTPWLRKFWVFNVMPEALALFAGIALVGVVSVREPDRRATPILLALLIAAATVTYPLLLPGILGIVGTLVLLLWVRGHATSAKNERLAAAIVAAWSVVALIGSAAALRFMTASRGSSGVELSGLESMLSKLASAPVALLPFLVAALAAWWKLRPRAIDLVSDGSRPNAQCAVVLLGGALASIAAQVLFHLNAGYAGTGYNEYKLMFTAAICLAPFVALALESWVPGGRAEWATLVASMLVVSPVLFVTDPRGVVKYIRQLPPPAERAVWLHVDGSRPAGHVLEAIRARTPSDAIIVAEGSEVFLPAATARSMFAPRVEYIFPGYSLESRKNLELLRGYPVALVEQRIASSQRVFDPGLARTEMPALLSELMRLHRPLVIVTAEARTEMSPFIAWLVERGRARLLERGAGGERAWLVKPNGGADAD
jgi:hypothetical protein